MITFTPLSGAADNENTVPLAYVLQVDDVRILLDCGSPDWCPERLNVSAFEHGNGQACPWESYVKALKMSAPTIDLVLLSHGDLQHSGMYAYAYVHWGLRAPTYTTLPVQAMARTAALEEVETLRSQGDVDYTDQVSEQLSEIQQASLEQTFRRKFIATSEEVRDAFETINTLRYSQPAHLQGKCQGLTITAFSAGHTLGGAIWKIRSPSAGTIVYAVDLNHLRERHLDGTVLLKSTGGGSGAIETLARPDLFITDADRVNNVACRKKDRDAQLIDTVTSTLSSRHSVLIPCDSSTRLLELLVLLDQHWNYSRLKHPICLVSRTGREMLTFVRSMMEWLGGTISKEDVGEDGTGNGQNRRKRDDNDEDALGAFALRFKYLEFFPSPQALLNTYSSKEPKLILAVPNSLSHGPSRAIFSEFASIPDNVVLLTSPGEQGTLCRALFDMWNDQQREDDKWNRGKLGRNVMLDQTMKLTIRSKEPLQGAELEEYLNKERVAKEKEAAEQAAYARTQRMLEADEDISESEEDEEDENEQRLADDSIDVNEEGEQSPVFAEPGVGRGRRKVRKEAEVGDWGFETEDGRTKQMLSYDIYLRGNVSKAVSFFKADGAPQQKFRMFPFVEQKRRVDSYGEILDIEMWLRKGKVLEEEAEGDEIKNKKKEAEEESQVIVEPPSKFVSQDIEVQLVCRLLFVDMEGLNDGRAIKKIVANVNPRKMIIVHSSSEGARSLIEACSAVRALTKEIYAPGLGELIQIGQQMNSYSISLSEDLLASVRMSKFEDNEVGSVQGCIASLDSSTIPVLEPLIAPLARPDENAIALPMLPRRLGSRPATKLPQSTMIGDLKLTALKTRLSSMGVRTEFAGEGVLLCHYSTSDDLVNSVVAVKKTADGKVELEGSVTSVYYAVRKVIYDLHALVAS